MQMKTPKGTNSPTQGTNYISKVTYTFAISASSKFSLITGVEI